MLWYPSTAASPCLRPRVTNVSSFAWRPSTGNSSTTIQTLRRWPVELSKRPTSRSVEPEVGERQCRRAGVITDGHEEPALRTLRPFEGAPWRSSVERRQVEEWPGRVRDGRDDPGALLVRARIHQAVGGRAGQCLLQLLTIKFEQLGDALRLAPCRDLKQAFQQRPAGLAEEVVRSAFVPSRRFGNQRRRECRRVGLIVALAQLKPGRPVGAAFIDRVEDQVATRG